MRDIKKRGHKYMMEMVQSGGNKITIMRWVSDETCQIAVLGQLALNPTLYIPRVPIILAVQCTRKGIHSFHIKCNFFFKSTKTIMAE